MATKMAESRPDDSETRLRFALMLDEISAKRASEGNRLGAVEAVEQATLLWRDLATREPTSFSASG
jgi:hypothetical protein